MLRKQSEEARYLPTSGGSRAAELVWGKGVVPKDWLATTGTREMRPASLEFLVVERRFLSG